MQRRIFAGLLLASLLAVCGGVAQSPSRGEKPVWTMEFIKVKPGMFGFTLGYLDDNWTRIREEGKAQGAILNYYRIANQGGPQSDGNMVLLTEYKNQATYDSREQLFDSIRKQLPNNTSGVLRPHQQEELYDTVSTRVFQDYSDTDKARLRLLAANGDVASLDAARAGLAITGHLGAGNVEIALEQRRRVLGEIRISYRRKSNGEGTRRDIISFDLGSPRWRVVLGLLEYFDEGFESQKEFRMVALPNMEAAQQRNVTEAQADESTVSANPKKKLATYTLCWHECPACDRTWFHRTPDSKTADRYLAKCPTCLNPHQPGDLNTFHEKAG